MYVGFIFRLKYNRLITKEQIVSILFALVLGSFLIFINNERTNMVINRYGIFVIFFVAAILVSLSFLSLFKLLSSKRVIRYLAALGGGKNTIIILGFNYFFNGLFDNICILLGYEKGDLWIPKTLFVILGSLVIVSVYKRWLREQNC